MVMHTHMLNPRVFLEDAMRSGLARFWSSGMPWHLVKDAVGQDLEYRAPSSAHATWSQLTGREWDNSSDTAVKRLDCFYCSASFDVPWTTCGTQEKDRGRLSDM